MPADPVTRAGWPVRVGMKLRRLDGERHLPREMCTIVEIARIGLIQIELRRGKRTWWIGLHYLSDRYEPVEEP